MLATVVDAGSQVNGAPTYDDCSCYLSALVVAAAKSSQKIRVTSSGPVTSLRTPPITRPPPKKSHFYFFFFCNGLVFLIIPFVDIAEGTRRRVECCSLL
jgi:hypothetical protein